VLWLVLILLLFIIQVAAVLVLEFRYPAKTIAWLMVLFLFPGVGFIMWFFVAQEYSQRKKVRRKSGTMLGEIRRNFLRTSAVMEADSVLSAGFKQDPRLFGLLNNIPGSPITGCNEVKVLSDTKMAYDALLQAMESAKNHIHFEFYTIRNDEIGGVFQKLMIRKAKEGVKVRCMFDGIGSYRLKDRYVQELKAAGVEVYIFLPPVIAFFKKRMNYRNHRKIVVVDGCKGFVGGINVGDEYLGKDPKLGFWRDTHLELSGDAVFYLQHIFLTDWMFTSGQSIADSEMFPEHDCPGSRHVQIIASGPDAHWDAILEMYFGAISSANKRIWITTPYFIPDASIIMGLKTAAISGVDVRIIFPDKPDSKIVGYASRSYMEELMQAGVRFYAYKKGFIHAKVLLIDDFLSTVGTANMDMRSFFSNFELNAVMYDKETQQRLDADFKADMANSDELQLEQFEKRPRMKKAIEVLARLFSPLL
jgi:cardiolipin synthase